MSLLNFFRKGYKKEFIDEVTLSWETVPSFIALEEEMFFKEILPSFSEFIEKINLEFSLLRQDFSHFKNREIQSIEFENIAKQMRDNLVVRVEKLAFSPRTSISSFGELSSFSADVDFQATQITKIISDNRYVFSFFKSDMEIISSRMKKILSLNEELNKVIESNKEKSELFSKALNEFEAISSLKSGLIVISNKILELNQQLSYLKEKERIVSLKIDLEKISKAEKELSIIRNNLSNSEADIMKDFTPLNRCLRKYQKQCTDKDYLKSIEFYFEVGEKIVFNQKDLDLFKKMLSSLKNELEKGLIEENPKERKKVLLHISNILNDNLNEKIRSFLAWKDDESSVLNILSSFEREIEEKERLTKQILEINFEISALSKKASFSEEKEKERKKNLENLLSVISGKRVLIS